MAAGWRVAGGRRMAGWLAEERGDLGGGAGYRRPGDRRAGAERAVVLVLVVVGVAGVLAALIVGRGVGRVRVGRQRHVRLGVAVGACDVVLIPGRARFAGAAAAGPRV